MYRAILIFLTLFFASSPLNAEYKYIKSSRPSIVENGFADIVENLLPAVVNISTTQTIVKESNSQFSLENMPNHPFFEEFKEFFGDNFQNPNSRQKEKIKSLGSGFIIDSKGYIVTNYHVISGADEIMITLHDSRKFEAKVIGVDPKTDIALLKVNKKKLPFVEFGNSDKSRVGDWVIAIGNPYNLGGTVTTGIVSARGRDINSGPFDDFIQTDAAINKGNSGGPMFNLDGEVIGVNSAIYSPSGGNVGIGFAVPSLLVKSIVEQLKINGSITRGWLGVSVQNVKDEYAESLGMKDATGALVIEIIEGGPADKAGLLPSDIILEFDGSKIEKMRDLPKIVASTEVGKMSKILVLRKGKEITLETKVGKLKNKEIEKAKKEKEQFKALGMTMVNIDDDARKKFDISDSTEGVAIIGVDQDSEASMQNLKAGDVIQYINQDKVKDIESFEQIFKKTKKKNRKSLLLFLNRKGKMFSVAIPFK